MAGRARRAAVFFDRDGTLIRDVEYLRRADQIEILPSPGGAVDSRACKTTGGSRRSVE